MINFILVTTTDGGFGYRGQLPWHYKEDFTVFKKLTLNSTIVMGRSTWESLPRKPLPDRYSLVITSEYATPRVEHGYAFLNMDNFLQYIGTDNEFASDDKAVWVIGGARLFKRLIPLCSYVHHTNIDKRYPCDTFFDIHKEMSLELINTDKVRPKSALSFSLYRSSASPIPRNTEYEKKVQSIRRRALGIEKTA